MTKRGTTAIPLPADRLAAWRLARQRLDHAGPARDPEQVATELVGVQAQVPSAATLSIALRTHRGQVAATAEALAARRLVRARAMRGTLHLFAAAQGTTADIEFGSVFTAPAAAPVGD